MGATSVLARAKFDLRYFGHDIAAKRSIANTVATAVAVPLGSAALSSLCVVAITFADYPWFAVAGFVATYTLFWLSLSVPQLPE
jgi:hypothetical protein